MLSQSAERLLIVNADDFGQSVGVNRGVVRAHQEGIVTAASLMVRWPAAREAAAYARERPHLDVGLHLDLGEWYYAAGEWRARYQVLDTADEEAVEAEVDAQLAAFQCLLGREPTHLDSHQHVHRQEPVCSIVYRAGRRLGVPVRDLTPQVLYRGDFYGQDGRGASHPEAITIDFLLRLLAGLPEGVTELGCHPGGADDELDSTYRTERPLEVATLCDRRVPVALDRLGIRLTTFAEVAADDSLKRAAAGPTRHPPG